MSPLRDYRCPKGHEWEAFVSMSKDSPTRCPECGAKHVRVVIQKTQRPIVKSGTPSFHGRRD